MRARRSAHPWLALPPPFHAVGEEIEVATLPLSQKRVAELQHVAVHYTVLSQGVVCTQTQTDLREHQWISSAVSSHCRFKSNSLYPPRGRAVCSLPSCEPHSCPCPSWRPRRRSLPPPAASALIWPGGSSCTAPGRCLTTTRQRNGEGVTTPAYGTCIHNSNLLFIELYFHSNLFLEDKNVALMSKPALWI